MQSRSNCLWQNGAHREKLSVAKKSFAQHHKILIRSVCRSKKCLEAYLNPYL